MSVVLFKKLSDDECIIKNFNGDQTLEDIAGESEVRELGPKAYKVTLKKAEEDKGPWNREVYFFQDGITLEKLRIFNDEFIKAACENTVDYQGKTEWKAKNGATDPESEDADMFILFKDNLGRKDAVRVEFDQNNNDKLRHAKLMESILNLTRKRIEGNNRNQPQNGKKERGSTETTKSKQVTEVRKETTKSKNTIELGELKFSIVDKKGRKIKIMIKNDSDNEEVDSSDQEGEDTKVESAYYHLMVEDQKVLPYRKREVKRKTQTTTKVETRSQVVTESIQSKQISSSPSSDKLEKSANRAVLSRIAAHQGLTFANEQMFDSFVKFMESLPEDVNQQKAVANYKEMVTKVMSN